MKTDMDKYLDAEEQSYRESQASTFRRQRKRILQVFAFGIVLLLGILFVISAYAFIDPIDTNEEAIQVIRRITGCNVSEWATWSDNPNRPGLKLDFGPPGLIEMTGVYIEVTPCTAGPLWQRELETAYIFHFQRPEDVGNWVVLGGMGRQLQEFYAGQSYQLAIGNQYVFMIPAAMDEDRFESLRFALCCRLGRLPLGLSKLFQPEPIILTEEQVQEMFNQVP